ncbi:MAG TPA: hypothetical protein VN672_04215 [Solirubrobacteraceae bacterium]|nr:hypothetical protein [Solirubrobacteraceae bacterium]
MVLRGVRSWRACALAVVLAAALSTPAYATTITASTSEDAGSTSSPPPSTTSMPSAESTIPVLTGLGESYSRFAIARARTRLTGQTASTRHHAGATFVLTLDRAATVRVLFQLSVAGRRAGGSCKPASRKLRRKPRCALLRTVGALGRSAHEGSNEIPFTGRIGVRALRPGRYLALFTASNAAGTSPRQSLRFTIVPR